MKKTKSVPLFQKCPPFSKVSPLFSKVSPYLFFNYKGNYGVYIYNAYIYIIKKDKKDKKDKNKYINSHIIIKNKKSKNIYMREKSQN